MNYKFKYSVLRFTYSQIIGERINIAILLYSSQDHKLRFLYPNSLHRINSLYSSLESVFIRSYLSDFNQKVGITNKNIAKSEERNSQSFFEDLYLEHFIDYLLVSDSNSLEFSPSISGKTDNVNILATQLYKQYLDFYAIPEKLQKRDEQYIAHRIDNVLKELPAPILNTKIRKDVKLAEEEFKFVWKNGSTNYVKPLSFDLTRNDAIRTKSYYWHTALELISNQLPNQSRIDFFVTKPEQKDLFNSYDKAISLITDTKSGVQVQIIEEESFDRYLSNTKTYLSKI